MFKIHSAERGLILRKCIYVSMLWFESDVTSWNLRLVKDCLVSYISICTTHMYQMYIDVKTDNGSYYADIRKTAHIIWMNNLNCHTMGYRLIELDFLLEKIWSHWFIYFGCHIVWNVNNGTFFLIILISSHVINHEVTKC